MRRWKRFVFPGALGLAFYAGVAGGEYSLAESRRARAELADRREELRIALARNDSLRARIHSLSHSDEALERLARERYGFIRDGEYLYRISQGPLPEEVAEPGRPAGASVLGRLRRGLVPGRSR